MYVPGWKRTLIALVSILLCQLFNPLCLPSIKVEFDRLKLEECFFKFKFTQCCTVSSYNRFILKMMPLSHHTWLELERNGGIPLKLKIPFFK